MVQVADVLAHEGLAVHDQRDRVLQVGAERQHRPGDRQRGHGPRRVAPAAAQDHRPQRSAPHDRVLHPPGDRPLADEERIGQTVETPPRVPVLVRDRLARPVGAGHDQHFGRSGGEEQMVQRRVGEHHAKFARIRGDVRQDEPAARQDDRRRAAREQRFRFRRQLDQCPCGLQVPHHERERLLLAVLPLAESADGRRVPRVAREMVPAEALHGHDGAAAQQVGGEADSASVVLHPVHEVARDTQPIVRPAGGACDGLRMKPAAGRVVILPGAGLRPSPTGSSWSPGGHRAGAG